MMYLVGKTISAVRRFTDTQISLYFDDGTSVSFDAKTFGCGDSYSDLTVDPEIHFDTVDSLRDRDSG